MPQRGILCVTCNDEDTDKMKLFQVEYDWATYEDMDNADAISDANAPVPAKLPFDKARKSLNDTEIWELSVSRCNAHGLFVHKASAASTSS